VLRPGDLVDVNPIFERWDYRAYTRLIIFLESQGYTVRTFPYDWRLDLDEAARRLRSVIERTGAGGPVDIVAHSQGGLVARSYLLQHPGDERVGTVVYLGTPHFGAPKAYSVLRGFNDLITLYGWDLSGIAPETQAFVSQNFPAVYQLLPRFNFVLSDVHLEPIAQSFATLSNQELVDQAAQFHGELDNRNPVERSFQINGSGQHTLLALNIQDPECMVPLLESQGDGTVPVRGSGGFSGTEYFFVDEEHSKFPGNPVVQSKLLRILQDRESVPLSCESDPVPCVQGQPFSAGPARTYRGCSPIRLQMTDALGNENGFDATGNFVHQEIPGSAHFRFPKNEARYIPFEGEYTVNIEATAAGLFTLIFETVEPDGSTSQAISYRQVPIGEVSTGEVVLTPDSMAPALSLDLDGDGSSELEIVPNEPIPPANFVRALGLIVPTFGLPSGIERSLVQRARAAEQALKTGRRKAARGILCALKHELRAQRGKKVPAVAADALTSMVDALLGSL
jgi:pimeloyl-ACP methyl ester carboxylesterase